MGRDARAVESNGLENRQAVRPPGFESQSLRFNFATSKIKTALKRALNGATSAVASGVLAIVDAQANPGEVIGRVRYE